MGKKHMFTVGLVSIIVLGISLIGECETSLNEALAVKNWDFEDGKVSGWTRYDNWVRIPPISVTEEALNGNYSINVKFDDTTTSKRFDKGFMVGLNPSLSWKDFNSVSFRYLIEGEIANIKILFYEIVEDGKGNWLSYTYSHPVIGKPAEFCISTDEFRFSWSDNETDFTKPIGESMTGKIVRMYISVHNKKPVNSGLKFSFTIDDILLGHNLCESSTVVFKETSLPLAIAARTKEPILIDGKLNEWSGAVPIALTKSDQITCSMRKWKGPPDLSAVAMLLWDNDYLYFGIKVQDNKVVCADPRTDYDLSANDAVNLFLRTSQLPAEWGEPMGQDDYGFCMTPFSPKGPDPVLVLSEACIYFGGYPHKEFPIEKVHIASSQYKNGYIIEMAIPWQALKITPEEGKRLGFFTHIHDSDKPSKRAQLIRWREKVSGNWWRNPSDWGQLVLAPSLNKKELLTANVTTGVVPMTDHLEYERNQDVTCTLDFWGPLGIIGMDITGQIVNVETKMIAGDSLLFSTKATPLSTQFLAKWNTGLIEDGIYAVLCKLKLGKEESISVIGPHFKLIGLSAEKRKEKIALSKIKLDNLRSQLKRKGFSCLSSWLVDEGLKEQLKRAYTERIDPSRWSLSKDPVTWEDLGGEFQGHIQNGWVTPRGLDTCYKHYDFGRGLKAINIDINNPNWKDWFKDIASRNIFICEIVPWGKKYSKEKYEYIRRIMGKHFFGFTIGEQDGYYTSIAQRYSPTSRLEAQKLFWNWTKEKNIIPFHYYVGTLGSTCWCHQYAAMGWPRIIGLETSQGLPSDIMMWAFLRGASKQYGILSWNNISVFNRWGYKNYTSTKGFAQYECGPDKGTSLSLLKRLYYTTYMYGSATNGFESSYFTNEKDEEGYPKLSPLGKINVEAVKWCRKHNKDKGVQYAPVALLIDFTSGWLPPRHLYTGERYLVWGNMPYEKGDYQIDNFFRWIYPRYEDSGYYRDERGFLTATPFGDKFDVLTSDVQQHILHQYSAICLLGELNISSSLIRKLRKFVKEGGDLIVSAAQAKVFGADFCGVIVSDKTHCGHGGLSLSDQKVFEEKEYIYTEIVPEKAKVLAVSGDKLPLITIAESGKGRVIVITPDYWMTTRLKVNDSDIHAQRYEFLKVVQHVLGEYFNDLDFIEVDGSKIQYIVNLTQDNKRLVLTLVNNDREVDWEGTISLKNSKILKIKEWMEEKQISPGQPIRVKVPKGDLRVLEVISDKPLFIDKVVKFP